MSRRLTSTEAVSRPDGLQVTCSDCDGTGIDADRRPSAIGYLHHPSSLCRECRGRGLVTL